MADIFISYAKKNRSSVEPLAKALGKKGWSVWWDPIIPTGKDFDEVIEEEISKARCVIVIWTKRSVKSKYLKGEARDALERGVLVPIQIESGIKPPYDFRSIQTLSLINWDGSDSFPGFQKLVADIVGILGKPPIEEQKRIEAARKAEDERKQKETEANDVERKQGEAAIDKSKVAEHKPFEQKPSIKKPNEKSPAKKIGFLIALVVAFIVGAILLFRQEPTKSRTEISSAPVKQEPQVETNSSETSSPQKFTNNIGMKFALIQAGSFTMGSQISPEEVARRHGGQALWYEDEQPPHRVEITKPFYLQTTEVSQGQWEKVMGNNPSYFKNCGDGCPVENVSWDDARKFIQKLNEMEGTDKYRLPTEAEWEYACRAGTSTIFSFGDDEGKLGEYAWYKDNSKKRTHPVEQKEPNPWGLYDIHGNVFEWVEDDWHDSYNGTPTDGSAWIYEPRGPLRVMRGGSWDFDAHFCQSAKRGNAPRGNRDGVIGFRVAQDL